MIEFIIFTVLFLSMPFFANNHLVLIILGILMILVGIILVCDVDNPKI